MNAGNEADDRDEAERGAESRELRILVELAANGDLSPQETAEVEELIADKPRLRAEYARLRSGVSERPPASARPGRSSGGCLVGIAAFTVGLIAVLVIGFILMPRSQGGAGVDEVDVIIEDADQTALGLEGPSELTSEDRLALIYSPGEGAAVLLGTEIPSGGELYRVDDPDTVIAQFDLGTVRIVIDPFDPDGSYAVRETTS